jgi:hypothetical protein
MIGFASAWMVSQLNGYHLKASATGRIVTQSLSRNQCVRRDLLLSLFLGKRQAMDPLALVHPETFVSGLEAVGTASLLGGTNVTVFDYISITAHQS